MTSNNITSGEKTTLEQFIIWFTNFVPEYDEIEYMEDDVFGDFDDVKDALMELGEKTGKWSTFEEFVKFLELHAEDEIILTEKPSEDNEDDYECFDYSFTVDGILFDMFTNCGAHFGERMYF